jgi:putative FmdB family regulatory protein
MTYDYECKKCNKKKTVHKPMSQADKEEKCTKCKKPMARVWSIASIKTGDGIK